MTVIGCQCGSATEGANLSPEVQQAVPEAVAAIEREIQRLTSPT
jgi:Ni,Fe-hydrogenase maturation factor